MLFLRQGSVTDIDGVLRDDTGDGAAAVLNAEGGSVGDVSAALGAGVVVVLG